MKNKQIYRNAVIKKGKVYKFGQSLKKGQKVLIEEVCIGQGKYTYVAYSPDNMTVGMPVAPSQFEYIEKEKYVVFITRVSYCTKQFEVDASNRSEAKNLAEEKAFNTVFGEDNYGYNVENVFTKKQLEEMLAIKED
jgi:hypothetical protein